MHLERCRKRSISIIVARGCGRSETAVVMIRRAIEHTEAVWRSGVRSKGADLVMSVSNIISQAVVHDFSWIPQQIRALWELPLEYVYLMLSHVRLPQAVGGHYGDSQRA